MKISIVPLILTIILGFAVFSCNKDESGSNSPETPEDWPSDSIRILKSDLQFPWEILWGKDDFIWITERGGKISKINPKTTELIFTSSIPEVVSNGEGGLLGMVQDPGFLTNGFLYVVYNYTAPEGYREKVVRYTYQNETLTSPTVLVENIGAASIHNGSRLWITEGSQPKLFVSTGDASSSTRAQDKSNLNGKILRFNLDGSIPSDNPINGSPLWSYGHRNPQGLVIANGILYASEHGPNIEDEVNIIEKGRNYGWPDVKGPCDGTEITFCNSENVKEPIWSSGNVTVATSGLDYYSHDRISAWKNSLLLATLKDATLYQLKLSEDGRSVVQVQEYFRSRWGRLRDFCISPAGRVYLITSNGGNQDKLIEISKPE